MFTFCVCALDSLHRAFTQHSLSADACHVLSNVALLLTSRLRLLSFCVFLSLFYSSHIVLSSQMSHGRKDRDTDSAEISLFHDEDDIFGDDNVAIAPSKFTISEELHLRPLVLSFTSTTFTLQERRGPACQGRPSADESDLEEASQVPRAQAPSFGPNRHVASQVRLQEVVVRATPMCGKH